MPSTLPSSFASAAAGNHTDGRPSTRGEGGGFTDWARRTNGATQTFRRPSLATTPSSSNIAQRETSTSSMLVNPPTPGPGAYVPPHISASRNGTIADMRYSKDQLLDLYRQQRDAGELNTHISDLYIGEGDALVNGASTAKWGRRDESDDMAESICWDKQGNILPMGLMDMTDDERELFTSSVNAPLKAPNASKEGGTNHREGAPQRKSSVSHVQNNPALPSPLGTRASNRPRRDQSESYPFPPTTGSTSGKGLRDDSHAVTTPSALLRRRNDFMDSPTESPQDKDRSTAFGSSKRAPSGAFAAGLAGPSSPWAAPQNVASPGGAFGSFLNSDTGLSSPSVDKRSGFGRGESRLRNLMSKEGGAGEAAAIREEPSEDTARPESADISEDAPIGSAALGGAHDDSPRFETPSHSRFNGDKRADYEESEDRRGFSQYPNQGFSAQPDNASGGAESHSPTFTNPYQSPEQPNSNLDNDEADILNFHLPGLGGFRGDMAPEPHNVPFTGHHTLPRSSSGFEHRPFERQPSSTGLNRGFPTLGGLGGLGGLGTPGQWPPAQSTGTPLRERPGLLDTFAEPSLRSPGGLHSPAIGMGNGGGFGVPGGGSGTLGRSSRLGSLFQSSTQEPMRAGHNQGPRGDGMSERGDESNIPFGMHGLGSNLPEGGADTTEAHYRGGRSKFDDFFTGEDGQTNRSMDQSDFASEGGAFNQGRAYSPAHHGLGALGQHSGFGHQQAPFAQTSQRTQIGGGSSASNQPPPAQQKTMVMPDRIRWIYRDPQGNTQGPWSGLEMHDWYRAGFFSPELLVKKQEDADYEPLAQLIRRIGNSREPFLVPQIGIPGPPCGQPGGNAWPIPAVVPAAATTASAAQPPFASSFPSFGTTLTAEQQNALERRKQEEQYLMARQKEHLAQQQVLVKQMQMQGQHAGLPQQLHHQASAHSLHSQPSFGSLTSPGGFANTLQGMPGHFDNSFRLGAIGAIGSGLEKLGHIQEEESPFQRLNRGPSFQGLFTGGAPQDAHAHNQRTTAMLADRARLQQEQAKAEADAQQRDQEESRIANDRYQQFQDMRSSMEEERSRSDSIGSHVKESQQSGAIGQQQRADAQAMLKEAVDANKHEVASDAKHNLSLTEQVQQAASAKQSPAPNQSPWAKIDTSLPEPFPPPQSSSPLPAPAARRNRAHIADALAAESSSARASPSIETPSASLAPWAREAVEAPKQPSLREIQEAEARRAAKQEEIAVAARRAALEKELATLATLAIAPAPGLPSSSTWATVDSPATPASATSAWAKPTVGKVIAGGSVTKKTLQQIQKEEEALARKQRAAATAATNASIASAVAGAAQVLSAGKRYADLAGKAAAAVPPVSTGSWTTVGASGKVKAPAAPVAAVGMRSTSSPAPVAAVKPRPVATASKAATTVSAPNALAEFNKWAIHELAHDLNKGIQVDDFVGGLMNFPSDIDVITEAVHSVSQTMDSRHFAEEYVRRRALAEKGKIVEMHAGLSQSAHHAQNESKGWSEVARKGPVNAAKAQEESNAFKIVPAKKKGKK